MVARLGRHEPYARMRRISRDLPAGVVGGLTLFYWELRASQDVSFESLTFARRFH
jgi:hypothetical protein